jgi:primosomal protein N'
VGGSQLPPVLSVDLRDPSSRSRGAVTPRLAAGIRWALDAGGQVMLLLNRRGFATAVQCRGCGHTMRCPQCDIALTLHQPGSRGICHGCGLVTRLPPSCPSCAAPNLVPRGTGTQRLEDQIRAAFPGIRVARMDTDTMQSRGSHERTLDAFRNREIDILVGTQMIAKGLDFPAVMLVGVVNADASLHLADFRASERTCQLVTQVGGRSGRGPLGGRVVVRVECSAGAALLTVDDDGPGIPVEERERVFDRFYRRHPGETTGSGLGLAIVRAIADRHQAQITLGDSPLGGLRVSVRFAPSADIPERPVTATSAARDDPNRPLTRV